MPYVVITTDNVSTFCKKSCEMVVTVYMLTYSMCYLKNTYMLNFIIKPDQSTDFINSCR